VRKQMKRRSCVISANPQSPIPSQRLFAGGYAAARPTLLQTDRVIKTYPG
jgi:hypothetical protein